MTVTTRWWWLRHAPVRNHGGRIFGHMECDADLSDKAAQLAAASLLPEGAVWFTSQLRRSRQTAAALADVIKERGPAPPQPCIETDFAEQNFGLWQGLTHEEITARYPDASEAFWSAPALTQAPHGESFDTVIGRVGGAIERVCAAYRGRDIVVVAHAGTIHAALALALDLRPEKALEFSIGHLSLTRLDHFSGADGSSRWGVGGVNLGPGANPGGGLPRMTVSDSAQISPAFPPPVTFVLGGVRSGKSHFAERLVAGGDEDEGRGRRQGLYLATADAALSDADPEMRERIRRHRARRGGNWTTLEEPIALVEALRAHARAERPVLVDCLTLWLANLMAAGRDIESEISRLEKSLTNLAGPVVLISNEVGQGVVPDNEMARAFRDHAGILHQRIARLADQVVFMVAGLPHYLKTTNSRQLPA